MNILKFLWDSFFIKGHDRFFIFFYSFLSFTSYITVDQVQSAVLENSNPSS